MFSVTNRSYIASSLVEQVVCHHQYTRTCYPFIIGAIRGFVSSDSDYE